MTRLLSSTLAETVENLVIQEQLAHPCTHPSDRRVAYARSILLYDALVRVESSARRACDELVQISRGLTPVTRVVVRSRLELLAKALDTFGDSLLPLLPRRIPKNNYLHPLIFPMNNNAKSWFHGPAGLAQYFSRLAPTPVLGASHAHLISIPVRLPVPNPEAKAVLEGMFGFDSEWKAKAEGYLAQTIVREEVDIGDREALSARLHGVEEDLERLVELGKRLSRFLLNAFPAEALLS